MREKLLLPYFFFLFKTPEYNYKTLMGFASCSSPSSWVGSAWCARGLQLQQCCALVAEWGQRLSEASKLNVVHIQSVLLLWTQRILTCRAVPEEKSPFQQAAGQSQGHWPSRVFNINKFLCDFIIMFCYSIALSLQNRIKQTEHQSKWYWFDLCVFVWAVFINLRSFYLFKWGHLIKLGLSRTF